MLYDIDLGRTICTVFCREACKGGERSDLKMTTISFTSYQARCTRETSSAYYDRTLVHTDVM